MKQSSYKNEMYREVNVILSNSEFIYFNLANVMISGVDFLLMAIVHFTGDGILFSKIVFFG